MKHWYCNEEGCKFHSGEEDKVLKHAEKTGHVEFETMFNDKGRVGTFHSDKGEPIYLFFAGHVQPKSAAPKVEAELRKITQRMIETHHSFEIVYIRDFYDLSKHNYRFPYENPDLHVVKL